MRIIAGILKGRRLEGPRGPGLRPTSDSLRETLFNILREGVTGARVLDGFAGTGALGLEALSRGAASVTFVERDPAALRVLKANIERCGMSQTGAVIARDFFRLPPGAADFDLILLDPPYDVSDLAAIVEQAAPRLAAGGRLVLEHRRRKPAPDGAPALVRIREVEAGDSALAFYDRA